MGNSEASSYKHLDSEKRRLIEQGLNEKKTFTTIARQIGVGVSTIRREILRNRRCDHASYSKGKDRTDCAHLKSCKIKALCAEDFFCEKRLCKRCQMRICQDICLEYIRRICDSTEKAPFVCNACEHYGRCTLERWRYSADAAQAAADRRAHDSRSGIDMTADEMKQLEATIRAGFAKGQSIHHIFESNNMPCVERSFYRYVENQNIPILAIDLAKKVKYKKRKHAKKQSHISGFFKGHEYEDYLELSEEDRAITTEVDTVLGKRSDSKCILSLHRIDLHFQIYLLLQSKTTECVVEAFDWLEECCEGRFSEFFGLCLFDRGSEFDDIAGLERSCKREGLRMAAYFTDPSRPDQKGSAEKNHVELRKLIPKGMSMQGLDAYTLAEICSHVNSTIRKGCGNTTPIQMAQLVLPTELFDNLGLQLIPTKDVIAAPGIIYLP
jgi:IS30 family transposase